MTRKKVTGAPSSAGKNPGEEPSSVQEAIPAAATITVGELLEAIADATGLHAQLDPGLAEFGLYGWSDSSGDVSGISLDMREVVDDTWPNGEPMRWVEFTLRGEVGEEIISVPEGCGDVARLAWDAVNAAYVQARAS